MFDSVLDERLQDERRDERIQDLWVHVYTHGQAVTKSKRLQLEIGLHECQFVCKSHLTVR